TVHVHHFPPGTSKWNKIEHRLFCHITQNWRGKPLMDRVAIVELIGATTTKAGLKVECVLDTRIYQKGIKVSKAEMEALAIIGDAFHPEWNYTIKPRKKAETQQLFFGASYLLEIVGNGLQQNADQSPLTQNLCQARSDCALTSRPWLSVVTDRP